MNKVFAKRPHPFFLEQGRKWVMLMGGGGVWGVRGLLVEFGGGEKGRPPVRNSTQPDNGDRKVINVLRVNLMTLFAKYFCNMIVFIIKKKATVLLLSKNVFFQLIVSVMKRCQPPSVQNGRKGQKTTKAAACYTAVYNNNMKLCTLEIHAVRGGLVQ